MSCMKQKKFKFRTKNTRGQNEQWHWFPFLESQLIVGNLLVLHWLQGPEKRGKEEIAPNSEVHPGDHPPHPRLRSESRSETK